MAELKLPKKHLDELKNILVSYVPYEEVWAYGSRVDGTSHEMSDLDIVVRHPDNLNESQSLKISELKEVLSNSNLPLIVDVHDWARLPESFRENIKKSYFVLKHKHTQSS